MFGGMVAATVIGIVNVPVLFVARQRLTERLRRRPVEARARLVQQGPAGAVPDIGHRTSDIGHRHGMRSRIVLIGGMLCVLAQAGSAVQSQQGCPRRVPIRQGRPDSGLVFATVMRRA
ncbi:hypothetical protein A6A40_18190 (plasmid) [Azospirillum humicireducens]|uniref:Uncharacterized protein n=1 Tax=Azospirillum humicireducens TaxID=1226968 RepID=A0A2R4VRE4_9PROT|nr:hypothetical protein A6A40_18190 [Azospirillum humicireducens]